jgi:hypothetical protein
MYWGKGMTETRAPLKIATVNQTIPPHGKAEGPLVTDADALARPKPKLLLHQCSESWTELVCAVLVIDFDGFRRCFMPIRIKH